MACGLFNEEFLYATFVDLAELKQTLSGTADVDHESGMVGRSVLGNHSVEFCDEGSFMDTSPV